MSVPRGSDQSFIREAVVERRALPAPPVQVGVTRCYKEWPFLCEEGWGSVRQALLAPLIQMDVAKCDQVKACYKRGSIKWFWTLGLQGLAKV